MTSTSVQEKLQPALTQLSDEDLLTERRMARPTYAIPEYSPLAPTIFHESWWLDRVTGGDYGVAEVKHQDEVVGRLPYFLQKKYGIGYSILPPMTHFLGPAVTPGDGYSATQFSRRIQITRDLIRQLPAAAFYRYKCHREITDSIAFQQEKFMTTVQFTFEMPPLPHNEIWDRLRKKKRKKIRAAMAKISVTILDDVQLFWRFFDANLQKKNLTNFCDKSIGLPLIEECLKRNRGCIYAAWNDRMEMVAAILCVWDATTSYFLMSSRVEDVHDGAISLLTWEAMKDASAANLLFDFDGLSNQSSVQFFTEFGGNVSPRYIVSRKTMIGSLVMAMKARSRESRYFY